MQHVSSFTAVPAAARKAAALSAYDAAILSPIGADWQSVAHMLRAAMPASKARAADAVPTWWADYALPRDYRQDSLSVSFADGVTIRCNIHTAPRKPPRIAKACRIAIEFYRLREGNAEVPAMVSVENLGTGATFDAGECSRLTADLRAAPTIRAAVVPVVTVEAVGRMAAEVERRRAGLAAAVNHEIAKTRNGQRPRFLEGSDSWRAALNGARKELAAMRRTLVPASDPVEKIDTIIFAATIKAEEINTTPGEAIATPIPVVEIADRAPEATGCENLADLTTVFHDQSVKPVEPLDTHTIVAVCTSHRGREKLFAALQDGCFPAARRKYHGAFMITLQDAQEIGEIRGVRFVGMPRRPRSKAAEPVAVSNVVHMTERDHRPLAAALSEAA